MTLMEPMDSLPASNPSATRHLLLLITGMALVVFGLFLSGVIFYARYGGDWLEHNVNTRIAESISARAAGLAVAGKQNEAVETYRVALNAKFDNPQQRIFTINRFAQLLIDMKQYDEAAQLTTSAMTLPGVEGGTYSLACEALQHLNKPDELLHMAQQWFAWATQAKQQTHTAWAAHVYGLALEAKGQDKDALNVYQEGLKASPTPANALAASRLLVKMQRKDDALKMLDSLEHMKNLDPAIRQSTETLRKQITTPPTP